MGEYSFDIAMSFGQDEGFAVPTGLGRIAVSMVQRREPARSLASGIAYICSIRAKPQMAVEEVMNQK